ncbi:hypothetical protein LCGC14_1339510 [marine sediment metagenome]|uniref:Uncharacterized protein n=1 Tax=marine sediment metagenome TaxID=412755 RepID=A0A0F9NGC0_9ZZZZ
MRQVIREEVKLAIEEDRAKQAAFAWQRANEENIRISEKLREALKHE